MPKIVLYQPEIPPNTGNIIRLCANIGWELHLIRPLGFQLDDQRLKRAGLDYHAAALVHQHESWAAYLQTVDAHHVFGFSTKAQKSYAEAPFSADVHLLFGPESRGLPAEQLEFLGDTRAFRIPMRPDSRSLNLSNAVAVVAYDCWRQLGFEGGI